MTSWAISSSESLRISLQTYSVCSPSLAGDEAYGELLANITAAGSLFSLPECLEITGPVNEPHDIGRVFGHLINEAIVSHQEFTDARITEFGHYPPSLREIGQ
jgi:hypothetical protein